ncbi:MAG: transposase [Clostridiales bacterium]|nr:transposase [Clostridiales bacterium]
MKSMASRAEFSGNASHRAAYTPRHCPWLNQIECWFGILGRQLPDRRASIGRSSRSSSRRLFLQD